MEIAKLIDTYGDDIFAFALIVTKDFNSAKEAFVRISTAYDEFSVDDSAFFDIISKTYALCQEIDSNESASTLTGIELDPKRQAVLEQLLVKRETVRTVAHMYYENEFSVEEIATIIGRPEKFVTELLDEDLDGSFKAQLEKYYIEICSKIHADDKLKTYVMRMVNEKGRRAFEVRNEAAPRHSWTMVQKIVVFVVAFIVMLIIGFIIPIYEQFKDQDMSHYENLSSGESFHYTYEAESPDHD